jgi:hypothetical protein
VIPFDVVQDSVGKRSAFLPVTGIVDHLPESARPYETERAQNVLTCDWVILPEIGRYLPEWLGWQVEFLEADLKTPLPLKLTL